MIVDSAVWIDFFSRKRGRAWPLLRRAMRERERVFVTPVIVQEVLQGTHDEAEFSVLKRSLGALEILHAPDAGAAAIAAAHLYARCRWSGITIRSSADCLIATVAVEHGMPLLTEDRNFWRIRDLERRLKLIELPINA